MGRDGKERERKRGRGPRGEREGERTQSSLSRVAMDIKGYFVC